jgi:hypothetical protein
MSCITLDKAGLKELVLEESLLPGSKGDIRYFMQENKELVHNKFFNIQRYEMKRRNSTPSRLMEYPFLFFLK